MVECVSYCRRVLAQRQKDGLLPHCPIQEDVRTVSGSEAKALGAIGVGGGFPCQGISSTGAGLGLDDSRSSLIKEAFRILDQMNGLHPQGYDFSRKLAQLKSFFFIGHVT